MRRGKKAQETMSMPFSVIFSFFLIIVFIIVAFIAAKSFLDFGSCSSVGLFYDDLQSKIDEAWHSYKSDFEFEIVLPSGVEKVCFANLSEKITGTKADYELIKDYDVYDANVFLVPSGATCDLPYKNIQHINISLITQAKNPYCVEVSKKLRIQKDIDKFGKFVFIN